MPRTIRPRRSVLYMPGSNARALRKAASLPADCLIFDLEDAVAPDAKREARDRVCEAAGEGDRGRRELVIRVNALATPWGRDDIVAASSSPAHALLLPKVESAGHVRQALAIMDEAGAGEEMAIWCMMETPLGMLHAEDIAGASPRIAALVMGTSDLTKDLNARHTSGRLPLVTSLGLCLLAARAFGIAIVDGVSLDLDDMAAFEEVCRQGRELGFDGKTLIHPRQLEPANRIFGPSEEELARARSIIEAHAEATRQGRGVAVVDGRLVESLHVQEARRLLELARAIERGADAAA